MMVLVYICHIFWICKSPLKISVFKDVALNLTLDIFFIVDNRTSWEPINFVVEVPHQQRERTCSLNIELEEKFLFTISDKDSRTLLWQTVTDTTFFHCNICWKVNCLLAWSIPINNLFLHRISFEWTTKLYINFLNHFYFIFIFK